MKNTIKEAVTPGPLCLMDLPTDIRVMIAEYALYYEDGITFSTQSLNGNNLFGRSYTANSCNKERPFNALCQVSRQWWNDTQDMPFKVNTVNILSSTYPGAPQYVFQCRVMGGLKLFINNSPPYVRDNVRSIRFSINFFDDFKMRFYEYNFEEFITEARNVPSVTFRAEIEYWLLIGDQLEDHVQHAIDATKGSVRNWHISHLKPDDEWLEQLKSDVDSQEWERALNWLKNGIEPK
ncbi:hypothetical protein BDV96DRAFT_655221 [Lophiotrema nucula]|uniref:Uncharacterized protein n=1 Tax=Lophiotrema nucula TaxID=690887 RepID=A0A6A5YFK8_9PLEO|nr:hypothetical protein BDV96DRAFT_655221 [Lophiotrema nucula]